MTIQDLWEILINGGWAFVGGRFIARQWYNCVDRLPNFCAQEGKKGANEQYQQKQNQQHQIHNCGIKI